MCSNLTNSYPTIYNLLHMLMYEIWAMTPVSYCTRHLLYSCVQVSLHLNIYSTVVTLTEHRNQDKNVLVSLMRVMCCRQNGSRRFLLWHRMNHRYLDTLGRNQERHIHCQDNYLCNSEHWWWNSDTLAFTPELVCVYVCMCDCLFTTPLARVRHVGAPGLKM